MAIARSSDRYNIRVVDRAVSVLNQLADGKPRTMTQLSKELEINSSTTFRLLATLRYHNLVQLEEATGNYRLGLACCLFELLTYPTQDRSVRPRDE